MILKAMRWTLSDKGEFAVHMIALLDDLDRESARAWLIKERPGRAVFRIPARYAGNRSVIAKYHQPRSVLERVKYGLLPTRAAREWKNAECLRLAGVPVPEMPALGEFYAYGLWTRAVLFARAVEPGTALNDYLLSAPPAADVRRLGARLAEHVARLHDAGFQGRDLHGWNILLQRKEDSLDLCFVDLDEMRARGAVALRHCADDLARLGVLAPVRAFTKTRFLLNYLRARNIPRTQWRDWIGDVTGRAARIARGLKEKYGREPDEFIRWFAEKRGASRQNV